MKRKSIDHILFLAIPVFSLLILLTSAYLFKISSSSNQRDELLVTGILGLFSFTVLVWWGLSVVIVIFQHRFSTVSRAPRWIPRFIKSVTLIYIGVGITAQPAIAAPIISTEQSISIQNTHNSVESNLSPFFTASVLKNYRNDENSSISANKTTEIRVTSNENSYIPLSPFFQQNDSQELSPHQPEHSSSRLATTSQVIVEEGDTLWDIAQIFSGSSTSEETNQALSELIHANPALRDNSHDLIIPGQVLIIPSSFNAEGATS